MKHIYSSSWIAVAAATIGAVGAARSQDAVAEHLAAFRAKHGAQWRASGTQAGDVLLYGGRATFAAPPTTDAERSAIALSAIRESVALHGVRDSDLALRRVAHLPLSTIGTTDKYAVEFEQELEGLWVEEGTVNVILDASGSVLSIHAKALPNLGEFEVDPARIDARQAESLAREAFAREFGAAAGEIQPPELRVLPTQRNGRRAPAVAWRVSVFSGSGPEVSGRHYWIDAHDGRVLRADEAIHNCFSSGLVRVLATPGVGPDSVTNPSTEQPLPHAYFTDAASNTFTTGADGNYFHPGVTGSPVWATFGFKGPFADVRNAAGANYSFDGLLMPGGGGLIVLSPSSDPLVTAQANVYLGVNKMRDWLRSVNPTDATGDFQRIANCNIAASCNAFYNGVSINFYLPSSQCPNTAYSTVVAHEDGHWLNSRYGTGNSGYGMGEGNADTFAMYLWNTPVVGQDFHGVGNPVRSGLNTRQYWGDANPPGPGESQHLLGQVWMGVTWKIRRNLQASYGDWTGAQIANALFSGWLNAYNQTSIHSSIECQWLVLDDDDGDLWNGTPHFAYIDDAFREHGFPGMAAGQMVAHFTFDNPANRGLDSSGAGNHAAIGAATVQANTCGASMLLGGDNNALELSVASHASLNLTAGATGMAWIKPLGQQSPDGNASCRQGTILSKNGNYWFQVEPNNDALGLQNEGGGADYVSASGSLPVGEWTHVAFVRQNDGRTVQFFKNGARLGGALQLSNLASANGSALTIGHALAVGDCEFNGELDDVRLWNTALCDADVVAQMNLSVPPPVFLTQPLSQCRCTSETFSLAVQVSTAGGASYRWRRNGLLVQDNAHYSGATTPTLTFIAPPVSAAGTYVCEVTNSCGALSSSAATVSLFGPPQLTQQPLAAVRCEGTSAQFSVAATGSDCSGGLSYQWLRNGAPVSGAGYSGVNSDTLTVDSVAASHAGDYRCVVSSGCGSVVSNAASLSVGALASIVAQPQGVSLCSGDDLVLTVSATSPSASPITSYEWRLQGASIGAPSAPTLIVTAVDALDAGVYTCRIHTACGPVDSVGAAVFVNASNTGPVVITPAVQTVCAGTPVTLTASGGAGGSIEWYAGSLSNHVGSGSTLFVPAPAVSTLYFARRESATCPPSPAGQAQLDVLVTPPNVSCAHAIALPAPALIAEPYDNSCAPDLGSPDCVRKGLWYSFVSDVCGPVRARVTAPNGRIAVYRGWCPSDAPLACADGEVSFQAASAETYTVHVGSSDASGAAGALYVEALGPAPCPRAAFPARTAIYTFTGSASGSPFCWKIEAADCQFAELLGGPVALAAGASPSEVATAFAASINAAATARGCYGTLSAVDNPYGIPGKLVISYRSLMSSGGLRLYVGPDCTPTCLVTTSTGGGGCSFLLPVISVTKDASPEDDCNENGLPDVFDLLFGASNDLDGDSIPDECTAGYQLDTFCSGASMPCPCGNGTEDLDLSGCKNSLQVGARLTSEGEPSLAHDTLTLRCFGLPAGTALFFQGVAVAPAPFGDGARCVAAPIQRLGTVGVLQNFASYPSAGQAPASIRGGVLSPGTSVSYQVWYRDSANWCTNATFNVSSALSVIWTP